MSKINTPPRGLQNFLGNVNQGVNPSDLDQQVNPTVDLVPFWGTDKLKSIVSGASIAGTLGQGITVEVPEGELWIPIAASGQYFVAQAQTRQISLRVVDQSGGGLSIIANGRIDSASLTAEVTCGLAFPNRFILPSSWGIRCQIDETSSATAATMEVNIFYYKLDA